jgi:transposase
MVEDIVGTKTGRGRVEIRTGIGRRRQWTDEEKGRIVSEAVSPGAVVSEVARRHDLTPQHLFTWVRASKAGRLALLGSDEPAFVPIVAAEPARLSKAGSCEQAVCVEIAIGSVKVRLRNGADAQMIEAVLRAVLGGV